MPTTLLQLTDTHLLGEPDDTLLGVAPGPALATVVEAARQESPDAVLVTGDLSQDGSAASYAALADALQPLGVPCYGIPGNHDHAERLDRMTHRPPFRPERSVDLGGWRILLLNSQVPGETHGRLSIGSLGWLAQTLLRRPETPTVLALHHPPVPSGTAWLDPLCLHDSAPLLDLVAASPQVRLVLCGHVHQALERRHAQARILATPATCFQFAPGATDFTLGEEPAGYRRLTLFDDGTLSTNVVRVCHNLAVDLPASGY